MDKKDIEDLFNSLKEKHTDVPEDVYVTLDKHLIGKFGTSVLTAGEVSTLAKELIAAGTPANPEGERCDDK